MQQHLHVAVSTGKAFEINRIRDKDVEWIHDSLPYGLKAQVPISYEQETFSYLETKQLQ